jgi:hypothetical protein
MYVNIIIFNSHAVSSIFFRHTRVFIGFIFIFGFLVIRARHCPAYLYLHIRRNLPYGIPPLSSSQFLHQLHQLEQVLIAKEASASGHRNKRIGCHYRGPARRNRAQTAFCVVEVNPILAPVMAIRD